MNWELLLWIACLAALIMVIVCVGVNSIIRGYFGAKEEHIGRMAGAIGNALSKTLEGKMKKLQDEVKKAKEAFEKKE